MADAADLKSAVFGRAGSSPAFGTSAGRGTGSGNRRVQAGSRERPRGKKTTRRIENADQREKKKRGAPRGNARPLPAARLSRFRSRRGNKKTFPRDFPAGTFFQEAFALRLICGGGAKPRARARPDPRADRTPTAPERPRPSPCKPASSRRPACLRPCLSRRRRNPSA